MQLEAEYRRRLSDMYSAVKRRLVSVDNIYLLLNTSLRTIMLK